MSGPSTGRSVAEITASLVTDFDLPMLLQRIAVHALDGFTATAAAVVLVQDGDAHVVAEATRPGADIDANLHIIGPGATSAVGGAVAMIDDARTDLGDRRWGEFRALAVAGGVRSVRAFPIIALGDPMGSLVVYTAELWGSERPNDFGQILANLVAVALSSGRADGRRVSAVDSVGAVLGGITSISMATGILAEHFDDDVDTARRRLARLARAHDVTASQYADRILSAHNQSPAGLGATGVLEPPPDLEPPRHIDT